MSDQIVIERLEFQAHCGTTDAERDVPQPLAVDVELFGDLTGAAATDDLARTLDYERVARRITETAAGRRVRLLETLGEDLVRLLFSEFPASRIRLWIRKIVPPVAGVRGSVGVRLDRSRPTQEAVPLPARFLLEQEHRLPKGDALDLACGSGRHALYLAARGHTVEALDRDGEALAMLQATAKDRNLSSLTVRRVDLEADPAHPPDLGFERYDTILVFFYLQRPLLPSIIRALRPGGVLLYETFLIDNHLRHGHPRRREFCLAHNELPALASGLRLLHYDEGLHDSGAGTAFTARLVAQKPPGGEARHGPA